MTEWIKERRTVFLTTYAALNDAKSAVDEAKEILADDPKDFTALVLHHALHPASVRAKADRRKFWIKAKRPPSDSWKIWTRLHLTSKPTTGRSCGRSWSFWRTGIWDGSRCSA